MMAFLGITDQGREGGGRGGGTMHGFSWYHRSGEGGGGGAPCMAFLGITGANLYQDKLQWGMPRISFQCHSSNTSKDMSPRRL